MAGPQEGRPEPDVPVAPGPHGHRGRLAPGASGLGRGLPRHRPPPAGPALRPPRSVGALLRPGGSRVVGPRTPAPRARVLVQTRVPDHPVLEAVLLGEPAPVLAEEALRQGPAAFRCPGRVSGSLAPAFAEALSLRWANARFRSPHSPTIVSGAGPGPRDPVRSPGRRAPAPGAASGWRSIRSPSERPRGGRGPPVDATDARLTIRQYGDPVLKERTRRGRGDRRKRREAGRVDDRDHVRRARHRPGRQPGRGAATALRLRHRGGTGHGINPQIVESDGNGPTTRVACRCPV